MNLFSNIANIYIRVNPIDLRKGIDGYASIIQSEFKLDPLCKNNLYIFTNKNHNKLKCLLFDGTGFWLLYKRLESGTFKWIKSEDNSYLQIEERQLRWLLDGLKLEQKTAFKTVDKKYL